MTNPGVADGRSEFHGCLERAASDQIGRPKAPRTPVRAVPGRTRQWPRSSSPASAAMPIAARCSVPATAHRSRYGDPRTARRALSGTCSPARRITPSPVPAMSRNKLRRLEFLAGASAAEGRMASPAANQRSCSTPSASSLARPNRLSAARQRVESERRRGARAPSSARPGSCAARRAAPPRHSWRRRPFCVLPDGALRPKSRPDVKAVESD